MSKIINGIVEIADNMNPVSRWIIRIGSVIIILVYISAIIVLLLPSKYIDTDYASAVCTDILYCGKECIGAVYIPAFIIELLDIADGKKRAEKK